MKPSLSAGVITDSLNYFYLLSFCPAEKKQDFNREAAALVRRMFDGSGEDGPGRLRAICDEAATRIMSFHTASRFPDEGWVQALADTMFHANDSPDALNAFQDAMDETALLPGRSAPDNRLHRRKGCRFCESACRYGYFSLVSDPDFKLLQRMLEEENQKPPTEQDPIRATWAYGAMHLWRILGVKQGFVTPRHLGNLTYCLLMLATAKSRFALPEKQIRMYQAANQAMIREWPERVAAQVGD